MRCVNKHFNLSIENNPLWKMDQRQTLIDFSENVWKAHVFWKYWMFPLTSSLFYFLLKSLLFQNAKEGSVSWWNNNNFRQITIAKQQKNFHQLSIKFLRQEDRYSPQQLYNTDETEVFWKKIKNQTFLYKLEHTASGFIAAKDRLMTVNLIYIYVEIIVTVIMLLCCLLLSANALGGYGRVG